MGSKSVRSLRHFFLLCMLERRISLESWIWDVACSIRGARDAPKYKEVARVDFNATTRGQRALDYNRFIDSKMHLRSSAVNTNSKEFLR
jgi:hypothetical protein